MSQRVVLIGHSGFIGSRIFNDLKKENAEVFGVSSKDLDLTSEDSPRQLASQLKDTDTLVFISALTPDRGKDRNTFLKNVQMGVHVSQAIELQKVAHVVYISSDAVYADKESHIDETLSLAPSGFHGLMHLSREILLSQICGAQKIGLTDLRPTLVYGFGDTHNGYGPNRFLRTALKDNKISLFGNGEEKRDHIDVGDVSKIARLCIQERLFGDFNLATGHSVSFHEVATIIKDLHKGEVEIVPSARANPITHRHFDIKKLVSAFPKFQPKEIHRGLLDAYNQLREA